MIKIFKKDVEFTQNVLFTKNVIYYWDKNKLPQNVNAVVFEGNVVFCGDMTYNNVIHCGNTLHDHCFSNDSNIFEEHDHNYFHCHNRDVILFPEQTRFDIDVIFCGNVSVMKCATCVTTICME